MYLRFLGGLVIFGFTFRVLLGVIALPLALLRGVLTRGERTGIELLTVTLHHVIISTLYSAFLAAVTLVYIQKTSPTGPLLYAITGFIFTFLGLSSNALSHAQPMGAAVNEDAEDQAAAAFGTGVGLLVGLIMFPVAFHWPELVGFVPGASLLFDWCFRTGIWLTGFWIVNLLLLFAVIRYVFDMGSMLVFGGLMLIYGLTAGSKAALRGLFPPRASTTHPPTNSERPSAEQTIVEKTGLLSLRKQAEELVIEGDYSSAVQAYKAIIRCDPTQLDIYELLMHLYARMNDRDASLQQYRALSEYYRKRGSQSALDRLTGDAVELGILPD